MLFIDNHSQAEIFLENLKNERPALYTKIIGSLDITIYGSIKIKHRDSGIEYEFNYPVCTNILERNIIGLHRAREIKNRYAANKLLHEEIYSELSSSTPNVSGYVREISRYNEMIKVYADEVITFPRNRNPVSWKYPFFSEKLIQHIVEICELSNADK